MRKLARSIATATLISGMVLLLSIEVIAPLLPPYVGAADFREEKRLNLPEASTLRLSNADGAISIRTHPDPSTLGIDIHADIRVYLNEPSDAAEVSAYVSGLLQVQSSEEVLTIITEPEARPNSMDIRVDYVILVPQGTNIEVFGSNGNIRVARGCGEVEVRGGNSDIEIVAPIGAVIAQSTNGRIRVLNALKRTDVSTVNGNIYAHMESGSLKARSANGHIVARLLNAEVQACDLESQNGGITVVLEGDYMFTLDAATGGGFVRSDFEVNGVQDQRKRRRLRGSHGADGTKLNLATLNGNIWIARG